ncbi:MAG: tetratricopeptide repeat protein [Armatimonadota bacterium]
MKYAFVLVLTLITVIAFRPVFDAGFVAYDDDYYVTRNFHVQAGPTAPSLAWAFTTFAAGNWHPLTWISHMLDCQLYGLNPLGHHLTSLLLHIANVLLLFAALTKLTGALWQSALVAALFAVHPLHVESVAWIAERKDVLSTLFWMLTMLAYNSYVRLGGLSWYLLVVFLFALGLLSKPMLVTLPVVLLILDYWPLGRLQAAGYRLKEKLPLLVLSAGSCLVTYIAQKTGPGPEITRLGEVPLAVRLDNAVVSLIGYLVKMVWPAKLAVIYPHPLRSIPIWQVIGSALAFVLISAAAIRVRKTRPYVFTGWLWYVVTLIPVIGLVQVGEQGMADRYTYIPLTGIFIVIVWGLSDLVSERLPRYRIAPIGITVGLIVILIACTHAQARYWRDSKTLFTRALQVTKNNYVAHLNLGIALEESGDYDGARRQYNQALRIQPDWPEALYNYAVLTQKLGNTRAAIALYRRTVRARPTHALAHYNLGCLYDDQGKTAEAIREYEAALRAAPDYAPAHNNLAIDLYETGQFARAWRHVHAARALGLTPHDGFIRALSSKMAKPDR